MQEVIEGLPAQEPRSNIDQLIEALAQRHNIVGEGEGDDREENVVEQPVRQMASPRGSRSGLRRAGDVEGVRQSSGNWQRDNTTPWNKPILARPMNPAVRKTQYEALYVLTIYPSTNVMFFKFNCHRCNISTICLSILITLNSGNVHSHAMVEMEIDNWRREMRRRPQPVSNAVIDEGNIGSRLANRKRNRTTRHGYSTRATRGEEQEDEEFEVHSN